jgi:hypothetical protein
VAFAAIQALRRKPAHPLALVLVGLLHGFGFSFVLREILGPNSPALLSSLFAFNVGIEIAQIAIAAAILLVAATLARVPRGGRIFSLTATATTAAALAIAVLWCVERASQLFT